MIEDPEEKEEPKINEVSKKKRIKIELIEYSVISKYFDEENDHIQLISLPTPESIQELINSKLTQDLIAYDMKKYKSLFKHSLDGNNQEENTQSEEKIYLDLENIYHIQDITMLSIILVFLGGINNQNDIYSIFPNETPQNPSDDCLIDNASNYLYYVYNFVRYLRNQQIAFPFSDLNLLFQSLAQLGFNIPINNKNILYRTIKDSFMSLLENRILVILAPSNNFWVKSEKSVINGINYDKKLNNYCNIFYNKKFIKKFLVKISRHPRCNLCLMSSMTLKNLKEAIDGLDIQFNEILPKKYGVISQNDHDIIEPANKKDIPLFFRNIDKIIQHLKQVEKWDYFDEKNILILEGDKNKMSDSTENNTIISCLFSEEFLESDAKRRYILEQEEDRIINYVVNLLENCPNDVRDYLSHNNLYENGNEKY